jgi:uncharacterized protein YutE (UPF0331/DUF86 family)
MKFEKYIKINKVVIRTPNILTSKGLIKQSIEDFNYIKSSQINENNCSFLFKSIYDCLRSIMESKLIKEGYKTYSHEASIQFLLENNIIKTETFNKINNYRTIRHDIVYRGKKTNSEKTKEIKKIFIKLLKKIQNENI